MPTIWQTSRIHVIAAFLALNCGVSLAFGDVGKRYQFKWSTKETLVVAVEPKSVGVDVKINENTYRLNLDSPTAQSLRTAAILHQLGQQPSTMDKENAVVFVARYPSQRKNPMGRCGTGYEDFLLLFGFDQKKFRLRDKFLLQSCLQTLALAPDGEDDPIDIVKLASNKPLQIQATWLAHPKYGNSDKTIVIRNKRFETYP